MLLKSGLSTFLLINAAAAMAQTGTAVPSTLQAEVQQKAMAFGQCINSGIHGLAPTVAVDAGASSVLAGCTGQRDLLVRAAEALIATLPEEQKAPAQAQLQSQLAQAQTQVAAAITRQRAAATATPAQ